MFGNGKKYQDPKSINRLISDVEKMKFDGSLNKKPEIKIGGEKVKLNMSVIDEMSETTYQGQSFVGLNGVQKEQTFGLLDVDEVKEIELEKGRDLKRVVSSNREDGSKGGWVQSNKFSFNIKTPQIQLGDPKINLVGKIAVNQKPKEDQVY